LVTIYQTTWRHIPGDNYLHIIFPNSSYPSFPFSVDVSIRRLYLLTFRNVLNDVFHYITLRFREILIYY
jgi:hypothetical protein